MHFILGWPSNEVCLIECEIPPACLSLDETRSGISHEMNVLIRYHAYCKKFLLHTSLLSMLETRSTAKTILVLVVLLVFGQEEVVAFRFLMSNEAIISSAFSNGF